MFPGSLSAQIGGPTALMDSRSSCRFCGGCCRAPDAVLGALDMLARVFTGDAPEAQRD